HVDSVGQIKLYLRQRSVPSVEIHQPTSLNKAAAPAPGFWQTQTRGGFLETAFFLQ
ncbi:hypothetical protein JOQ06_014974, partial [Pogonophryne albipinna]